MPKTAKSVLQPLDRSINLESLGETAARLESLMSNLREQITTPQPRKDPPMYTSSEVANLCRMDRTRFNYLLSKEETLPTGESRGNGRARLFTLEEARAWVIAHAGFGQRPEALPGRTLVSANFKGGSAKTTTAMSLAQALTLRGRKVLLIDVDPQASLTELCGVYTDKDVQESDTVMPFIYEPDPRNLSECIHSTYWDGLDVIPAHPSLFAAEFQIPAMIKNDPGAQFWMLLDKGIAPLKPRYDYILIDTAPSLSYLTINALMASDALIMPLVPESLDFISSVSFWSLFSDLTASFAEHGQQKTFDFVSVLLSKVDYTPSSSSSTVRNWIKRAYGDWVESIEVPASSAMSNSGLAISTVFDLSGSDINRRTLARVRDPLVAYADWIDQYYMGRWKQGES